MYLLATPVAHGAPGDPLIDDESQTVHRNLHVHKTFVFRVVQEWDRGCHERYGRLYQPNGLAWCAKYKSSSEWLQVDLGVAAKV